MRPAVWKRLDADALTTAFHPTNDTVLPVSWGGGSAVARKARSVRWLGPHHLSLLNLNKREGRPRTPIGTALRQGLR